MNQKPYFVGREDELARWELTLANPRGRAVLIVGPAGMGKSTLAERMIYLAQKNPKLACGAVHYKVTPNVGPYGTMKDMIEDAYDAAATKQPFVSGGTKDQWQAFFKAVGLIPVVGHSLEALAELVASLRRNPQRDTREQLIERFELISMKIPYNGRAIFLIDAAKELPEYSDQDWALVIERLPDKIVLIFTQRSYDVLAQSSLFRGMATNGRVIRLPEGELDRLDDAAAADLIDHRAGEMNRDRLPLRAALKRYNGHPYALDAALGLIAAGKQVEDLPADPTPEAIAEEQWKMIRSGGANRQHGDRAVRLFLAYAVLEVPVPGEVVDAVAEIDHATRAALLADGYLSTLLRREGQRRAIYHAILSDHILQSTAPADLAPYHRRAIDYYRNRLREAREEQIAPDALAAERLAEHALAVDGAEAFVESFVGECTQPLITLGLNDVADSLSRRALQLVTDQSATSAVVCGNLGNVLQIRGDLDGAEKMYRKALVIWKTLGHHEHIARTYGNLGIIMRIRGDMELAAQMHRSALAINERIGFLEGMANDYGNLGTVMRIRGDLNEAEAMYSKALEIDEKLGSLAGIADDYGNLGNVLFGRGALDGAEHMYRRSLKINAKLGRIEDVAINHGNLGIVMASRGDLDGAERIYRKALEIDEKLGRLEGMANQYGNLGIVMQTRGDLDGAEAMHRKALEINEKLGSLEGTAIQYANLGSLYNRRGDVEKAREHWTKARDLFARVGMPHEVEKVQGWLDGLPKDD